MSATLEILGLVGGILGLAAFIILWRRFPRRRVYLVAASLLLAGAAVFAVWWTMFRIDDPTFSADRDRAHRSQEALDKALGTDF
jgi:hypothetical protein